MSEEMFEIQANVSYSKHTTNTHVPVTLLTKLKVTTTTSTKTTLIENGPQYPDLEGISHQNSNSAYFLVFPKESLFASKHHASV